MHSKVVGILIVVLISSPFSTPAAQSMEDVVILKSGDILRGQIIELTEADLTLITRQMQSKKIQMNEVLKVFGEPLNLKSPERALGLSLLFWSGIGQWYNGDTTKGWLFFGWSFLSSNAWFSGGGSGPNSTLTTGDKTRFAIGLASHAICMALGARDAYRSAKRRNRENYGPLYEEGRPRFGVQIVPGAQSSQRSVNLRGTVTF